MLFQTSNGKNGSDQTKSYDLDYPLIKFTDSPKDWWSLRDAVRGVHIFGGIGAGKTSSSGKKIAKEFLKIGMGGIVLCAKPEEREEWESLVNYLYKTEGIDRRGDLIIFSEGSPYSFNPLKYERSRSGKGAGESFNLVNLLMNIYQMGKNLSGDSGTHSGDRFWDNALKRLIRRMIDLLKLANEDVSIPNMHALVVTLLSKEESDKLKQILSNHETSKHHLTQWGEQNFYIQCFLKATLNTSKAVEQDENSPLLREYFMVKNYFNREIITLAERTRTIITESFLGIVEPFLTGLLYKHFVQSTTILPDSTNDGFTPMTILLSIPFPSMIFLFWLFRKSYKYFKSIHLHQEIDYTLRVHSFYRGDSKYFKKLIGKPYKSIIIRQLHIQLFFEPLLTLLFGLALLFVDMTLSVALMVGGVCLFIDEWEVIRKRRDMILDSLDGEMDAVFIDKARRLFRKLNDEDIDLQKIEVGFDLNYQLFNGSNNNNNTSHSTGIPLSSQSSDLDIIL